MSRPTEAIATTAKLQQLRRGSWAGARGIHADDPEPLQLGLWVGAPGFQADPTPQTAQRHH